MSSQRRLVTFNDPIHGTIQLDWILGEIINTPEFQRLHHIKQLSSTFHVYPEAHHTRFGHSIGTAHLARKLVTHLQRAQPELGIEGDDVLCVQIAGLCHDLGHGPYSHLFDDRFLPMIEVETWRHEECSCRMFDSIVQRLRQRDVEEHPNVDDRRLSRFFSDDHCNLIKKMIDPSSSQIEYAVNADMHFLLEIISNKSSGVDVDKWDYFARDCHHLGIANSFNHGRFIKFTKVIRVRQDGGKRHICVRRKEAFNLYGMFRARLALHKRACQHKRKNAIDHMICDALFAAHEYVKVKSVRGIRNCIGAGQEEAFCYLDDRILLKIEQSADSNESSRMYQARNILKRISNGDRYMIVGEKPIQQRFANNGRKMKRELAIKDELENLEPSLKDKLRVTIATFNYGKGRRDPITKVWFYDEEDPDKAFHLKRKDVSRLLPSAFEENMLQVFCTDKNILTEAKAALEQWQEHITDDDDK